MQLERVEKEPMKRVAEMYPWRQHPEVILPSCAADDAVVVMVLWKTEPCPEKGQNCNVAH